MEEYLVKFSPSLSWTVDWVIRLHIAVTEMLKIEKIWDIVLFSKILQNREIRPEQVTQGEITTLYIGKRSKVDKVCHLEVLQDWRKNALLQSEMINNGCKIGALPGDSVTWHKAGTLMCSNSGYLKNMWCDVMSTTLCQITNGLLFDSTLLNCLLPSLIVTYYLFWNISGMKKRTV